jgi:hypothetical protein
MKRADKESMRKYLALEDEDLVDVRFSYTFPFHGQLSTFGHRKQSLH